MVDGQTNSTNFVMLDARSTPQRGRRLFAMALLISLIGIVAVHAQDDIEEYAPPPIKALSKGERSRLDGERDLKSRTKMSLELMNLRMTIAEKLFESRDYVGLFGELGGFQALVDDSLDFLIRRDNGSSNLLDNYKRLEIGLRTFGPRLESIRRELPIRYENYVFKLIRHVRDARTRGTDQLFADTVVPTTLTDR